MTKKIEDLLEEEVTDIVAGEADVVVEDTETVAEEATPEVDLAADIDAIFAGTDLSEEFKEKALRVYEASVIAMATQIAEKAEAALTESFNAELAAIQEQTESEVSALVESLNNDVEKYIAYVSENWLEENKLEATNIVKTELAESFMNDLGVLLERHNIELPDDKIDLYAELEEKYAALEAENNKLLEEAISLKTEKAEIVRESIVAEFSEGLTDLEKDKFFRLSEAIDYSDDESYKGKLEEIRESYFPAKSLEVIQENLDTDEIITLEEDVKVAPVNPVRSMPGFREIAKAAR